MGILRFCGRNTSQRITFHGVILFCLMSLGIVSTSAVSAKNKPVPTHVEDAHGPIVENPKVTSGPNHDYKESAHGDVAHTDSAKHAESNAPASEDHVPASTTTPPKSSDAKKTEAPTATGGHDDHAAGVAADVSMRWLQNGNVRYLKRNFRGDGRGANDRKRLVAGQKPHAIVLSCSDSRVPPEIVFDQALGEIFTIRVAGEALDSSVIASIEYAVEHLGSKLIVVMGHTQCGAVKAALATKDGESAGSTDLDQLIADIRPRLKTVLKEAPSTSLEVESALNADGVARDLVKRSEILKKKVESGDITIKSALYRLDSGQVNFY